MVGLIDFTVIPGRALGHGGCTRGCLPSSRSQLPGNTHRLCRKRNPSHAWKISKSNAFLLSKFGDTIPRLMMNCERFSRSFYPQSDAEFLFSSAMSAASRGPWRVLNGTPSESVWGIPSGIEPDKSCPRQELSGDRRGFRVESRPPSR